MLIFEVAWRQADKSKFKKSWIFEHIGKVPFAIA